MPRRSVHAGGYHSCAVDESFRVVCVGRDDHGQSSLLNGRHLMRTGLTDNCPDVHNPQQTDTNGNGIGDACE